MVQNRHVTHAGRQMTFQMFRYTTCWWCSRWRDIQGAQSKNRDTLVGLFGLKHLKEQSETQQLMRNMVDHHWWWCSQWRYIQESPIYKKKKFSPNIQHGGGVLSGEIYKGPNLRIGDTLFYTQRTIKAGYTVHKRPYTTIHKRLYTMYNAIH